MNPLIKHCLLILCIFFANKSFAQIDYITYHKEIIKAEELLVRTNLKDCLIQYKKTFDEYPKVFARDAFLAFQVACMFKDTTMVSYFFEKSVRNGIIWEAINYITFYQDIVSFNLAYKRRLESLYSTNRAIYESSIDTILRKNILALLIEDDKARTHNNDSLSNYRWMKLCDSNGKKLAAIIKRVGFPGEKMCGILNSEVAIVNGSKERATGVQIYPVCNRIFYHSACVFQDVKVELQRAVKNGELTPKEYALLYEWSFDVLTRKNRWWDKYYKFNCNHNVVRDKHYNFFLNDDMYSTDTLFVNQCRKEIGMCSLEHEKKLKKFGIENGIIVRFGFSGWF